VFVLKGKVYGHPTHRDGSRVTTSVIQRSIGRIVVCAGRRYLLGVVDAEYFRWLRANGHTLDHDNPVKINV
jgi:hypothetical protein